MSQEKDWYRGKYPPSLMEAIATHSILNTLGYSLVEEIFLGLQLGSVFVIITAEGKEATIRVGQPELALTEMANLWKDLIAEWNTGGTISTQEKDRLVLTSGVWRSRSEIVVMLRLKGFERWVGKNPEFDNLN